MDPLSIINTGVGLAGMLGIGGPKKSAAQKKYEAEQARIAGLQAAGYEDALARARAYDPVAEAQGTVKLAEEQAASTLSQSLRNLNARFKASGGYAGQDTLFNASNQSIARDVSNPLKAVLAEAQGNATQKKIAMLMSAVGAGNSVMGSLEQVISGQQSPQRDLSGSISMLSQGLGGLNLFGKAKKSSVNTVNSVGNTNSSAQENN